MLFPFFLFLLGQISDLSYFSSFFFLCVEGGSGEGGGCGGKHGI